MNDFRRHTPWLLSTLSWLVLQAAAALGQQPYEIEMQKNIAAEKVRQAGLVSEEQALLAKVKIDGAKIDQVKSPGGGSLAYASLLQQLGDNYHSQYKFGQAKPYYEQALAIRKAGLPADSPDLAKSMYGLASSLAFEQRLPEAVQLFSAARAILEKKYGLDGTELMGCLAGESQALSGLHRMEESAVLYRRMAALAEKYFGKGTKQMATVYTLMGSSESNAGHDQAAVNDYKKAKEIAATLPAGTLAPSNIDEYLDRAQQKLLGKPEKLWWQREDEESQQPSKHYWQPASPSPAKPPSQPANKPTSSAPPPVDQPHTSNLPPVPRATAEDNSKYKYFAEGKEITYNSYRARALVNDSCDLIPKRRLDEARAKLEEAITLDPSLPMAYSDLGLVLAKLGDNDKAIETIKKAMQFNGGSQSAWTTLAGLYQSTGQLEPAVATFKERKRRFPGDKQEGETDSIIRLMEKEIAHQQAPSLAPHIAGANGTDDYFADTAHDGLRRWPSKTIPLKIAIEKDKNCDGYRASFDDNLRAAFKEWQEASSGALQFVFVPRAADADIRCVWTSNSGLCQESAEGGEAQVQTLGDNIDSVRIILLTRSDSDAEPIADALIKMVSLHEIGHSLGLLGHSRNPLDVMYCSEILSTKTHGLSSRDIKTINLVYKR